MNIEAIYEDYVKRMELLGLPAAPYDTYMKETARIPNGYGFERQHQRPERDLAFGIFPMDEVRSAAVFLLAFCLLFFSHFASAQVAVVAQLTDGTGSVAKAAHLHFELENCGNNFPTLATNPGLSQNPWTIVKTAFDMTPNQPDGSILGQVIPNDLILCGNVASTYYQVTAYKDLTTPVAPVGGQPFVICGPTASGEMPCSNPGGGTWNPALQQPMFQPVAPGFSQVFQNPIVTQVINQPTGTALDVIGTSNFVDGLWVGPTTVAQLSALTGFANFVYVSDGTPGSNPCTGSGSGSFAFFSGGAWGCGFGVAPSGVTSITTSAPATGCSSPCTATATIGVANATTSAVGVVKLAGDLAGTATAPTVVNLSNATNASLANSGLVHPSLTVSPGTGLSGGGSIALGASATIGIASTVTAGSCTNCSLTYNAEGQITLGSSGSAGGVTGSGTTNYLPIWTGSSALGSSILSAGGGGGLTGTLNIGTGGGPQTGSNGLNMFWNPSGTCTGTSAIVLPTAGCTGTTLHNSSSAAGSGGVIANFSSIYFQNSGTLGMGINGYFSTQTSGGADSQGLHGESIVVGGTNTLNRGVIAVGAANGGGTLTSNEALACYTQVNGVTVTNNWCLHAYAPITLTSGAGGGVLVDAMPSGVSMKMTPQGFASLAACSSSNEGSLSTVNDANTATWGATISGGSSTNHVLAYCDGTAWTVAAK